MPLAITIFLPRAQRITKSFSFKPCLSTSSWIRLLSSSDSVSLWSCFVFSCNHVSFLNGGSGFPRQARRQAECQLLCLPAFPEPIFSGTATFSSLKVSLRYRNTRSTLRDNRFHRRRWDNYTISELAAKIGVFVRDSNSAVTVTLPTRKPTDTPRR